MGPGREQRKAPQERRLRKAASEEVATPGGALQKARGGQGRTGQQSQMTQSAVGSDLQMSVGRCGHAKVQGDFSDSVSGLSKGEAHSGERSGDTDTDTRQLMGVRRGQ